jgi:hypothetical protein
MKALRNTALHVGAYTRPWPNEVGIWRSKASGEFVFATRFNNPSSIGYVVGVPAPGPTGRWDYGGQIDVIVLSGRMVSAPEIDVLAGDNAFAVEAPMEVGRSSSFRDANV